MQRYYVFRLFYYVYLNMQRFLRSLRGTGTGRHRAVTDLNWQRPAQDRRQSRAGPCRVSNGRWMPSQTPTQTVRYLIWTVPTGAGAADRSQETLYYVNQKA